MRTVLPIPRPLSVISSMRDEQQAAPANERFSVAHSITSVDAWIAALFLMALAEVVIRLGADRLALSWARPNGPRIGHFAIHARRAAE
jgi:hypothetical protein